MGRFEEHLIYEDGYFRAEQCDDCCVPGYVVLSAQGSATSISGLSPEALKTLGSRLALLIRAIEEVVRPELVYCARFGAKVKALPFRLFPRTAKLARAFLADIGEGAELNGPLLLNWARERDTFLTASTAEPAAVHEVTHAILEHVAAG